jgi:hypothetical protein
MEHSEGLTRAILSAEVETDIFAIVDSQDCTDGDAIFTMLGEAIVAPLQQEFTGMQWTCSAF